MTTTVVESINDIFSTREGIDFASILLAYDPFIQWYIFLSLFIGIPTLVYFNKVIWKKDKKDVYTKIVIYIFLSIFFLNRAYLCFTSNAVLFGFILLYIALMFLYLSIYGVRKTNIIKDTSIE